MSSVVGLNVTIGGVIGFFNLLHQQQHELQHFTRLAKHRIDIAIRNKTPIPIIAIKP